MTPGYKTIWSSGESDLRAPSPAHDSSDDDFPASGLSAGTSAGDSDEGQRDVVWPPASIDSFHSSKAARLSSDSSSRLLRVWLPTRSVSPSLQISQRTSVDCGNADTCGSTSA